MKKALLVIIVIVVIGIAYGVFSSNFSNIKGQLEYRKTAKTIAIDYIKDKYNIDAKVTKITYGKRSEMFSFHSYLTGEVYLTMKYNGKKFYTKVKISSYPTDTTEVVGDSYQNEEIKKDCLKKLEEIFSQEPKKFYSNLDQDKAEYVDYYKEYYDKNNLKNFVPNFTADYINNNTNVNYAKTELEKMTNGKSFITVNNYKSIEAYNRNKEKYGYSEISRVLFLKGYYSSTINDTVNYYGVDIVEDDIIFVNKDYSNNIYSNNDYYAEEVNKTDLDNVLKEKLYSSEPYEIVEQYRLNDKKIYMIFLDKEKYSKYERLLGVLMCKSEDKYGFGYYSESNGYLYDIISDDFDYCNNLYYVLLAYKKQY